MKEENGKCFIKITDIAKMAFTDNFKQGSVGTDKNMNEAVCEVKAMQLDKKIGRHDVHLKCKV